MTYNYQNFLRPLYPGIKNIQIIDSSGIVKYTVNPFFITNILVNNNLLKINLRNDKTIILNFNNTIEAKSAIVQFQGQIDVLTKEVPIAIDKNIENYVENLNYLKPSTGNVKIDGHLLPGTTSTYNLGSPEFEWDKLYVASQSVIIGGVTISSHDGSIMMNSINMGSIENPMILHSVDNNLTTSSTMSVQSLILNSDGDLIRNGESVLYRYSGTASDELQLPEEGYIVELNTQDRLGFEQGQSLLVYNTIANLYAADDYVDDGGAFFVGEVSGYNFSTGLLELVVSYSEGYGVTNNDGVIPTYSFWYIETSPSNYTQAGGTGGTQLTISNPINTGLVTSNGTSGLIGHNNLKFDGLTFSIETTTKFQQTIEVLNTSTASTTITYDFNLGGIWFHDDLSSDFQPDFQNVPEIEMKVITSTIIIEQQGTAYLPTSPILINGNSYTIKWVGATPPSGTINQTDVVGFSFIRRNNDWSVLAQLSTFG